MFASYGGDQYKVTFAYDKDRKGRVQTVSHIWKVEADKSETLLGIGVSTCSKEDNFSRVVGRKSALAFAFKATTLDKPTRTAIWEKYLHTCRYQ